MTDSITEIAKKTLSRDIDGLWLAGTADLEAFAKLVIADARDAFAEQEMDNIWQAIKIEREACALVCDEVDKESQSQWPRRLATMIRARSKT